MMRGIAILVALSTALPASAAEQRIRTVPYDPDNIVRVSGRTGIQSIIEFGSDERIENVAVGDSSAWQVTPNRRANLLFIKPLVAASRTNLTVVTDRRTYLFDLVSVGREGTPVYSLKFAYSDVQADEPAIEPAPAVSMVEQSPQALDPHLLNFAWAKKGPEAILPLNIFDDGRTLYLAWDQTRPLPAISTMTADRQEATLNYKVSGNYILVEPIPVSITIRYGKRSATAWRLAPPRLPEARPVNWATSVPPQQLPAGSVSPIVASAPANLGGLNPQMPRPVVPAASKVSQDRPLPLPDIAALITDRVTGNGHEH